MIELEYTYDRNMLSKIEKKLGNLQSQAPKALKNALNMTGRKLRTDLKNEARKVYSVKASYVSSAESLSNASVGNLEATLWVRGPVLNVTDFKTSAPKSGAKAAVRKGGLKQIVGPRNIKAFKGMNGLIWQRSSPARPIKPLKAPSVPNMLRPEGEVYPKVEPTIMDNLYTNVEKQVQRILNSG